EGPLRGEPRGQPLSHRVLVARFVEAAVKDREKITHRRLGDLLCLFIGLIDVDMAAENKIIGSCFPTLVTSDFSVVTERVLDLTGCLVDLSRRQVTPHTPFNGFSAACCDPNRRMGLLQRARPERAVFELEKISFVT